MKLVYDLLPLPESFNAWGLLVGDSIYELMCKYITKLNINKEESIRIFRDVSRHQTMALFTWCLSHYKKYREIVADWLRDEDLQDTILSIVQQVMTGSESHTKLLIKCFGDSENELEDSDCRTIRINPTTAERIFHRFADVLRNFGANPNEDKIDYENCARVMSLLLGCEEIAKKNREVIAELLVCLLRAIIKSQQTEAMLHCWETGM